MVRSDQPGAALAYHRRIIHERSALNVFSIDAAAAFAAGYPAQWVAFKHQLKSHRLLTISALADLARRLDPGSVDHRHAAGDDTDHPPRLAASDAIQTIQTTGACIALRNIETVPEYSRFMTELTEDLALSVHALTGEMLRWQGVVVISSPGIFSPVHFDAGHWVPLQVTGTKSFAIFASRDGNTPSTEAHERFHGGDRQPLLAHETPADGARNITVGPGDGVYIPPTAAHSVHNGKTPSIALSIGWHSQWSEAERDARRANALLRRVGLRPPAPSAWPHRARLRPAFWRLLQTIGAG